MLLQEKDRKNFSINPDPIHVSSHFGERVFQQTGANFLFKKNNNQLLEKEATITSNYGKTGLWMKQIQIK